MSHRIFRGSTLQQLPFKPTDIPGLSSWWTADSIKNVANGAAVPTWLDSSGSGYSGSTLGDYYVSGTPKFVATAPGINRPALDFNGAAYKTNAPIDMSKVTILMVARPVQQNYSHQVVAPSINAGYNLGFRYGGQIEGSAGASNVSVLTSSFSLVGMTYDGTTGAWSYLSNGTVGQTGTSSTLPTLTGSPKINLGASTLSNTTDKSPFSGLLAEVAIWNRILTPVERAKYSTYVQDRYGIVTSDYISRKDPARILGMTARFRADSIQGLADGAAVTAWPDSSGYELTAVTDLTNPLYRAASTNSIVALPNGKPYVEFPDNNCSLSFTSYPSDGKSFSMSAVVNAKNYGVTNLAGIIGGIGAYSPVFAISWDGKNVIIGIDNVNTVASVPLTVPVQKWNVISITYTNAGTYQVFFNGTKIQEGTSPQYAYGSGFRIGNTSQRNRGWVGGIAEVFMWNRVISTTDLAAVHTYVQDRYGIVTSDYNDRTDPASIPGIVSRYKTDSITGVASGAGVLSWPDTGAYLYPATAPSSVAPILVTGVLNGKPVVRFGGNKYFVSGADASGNPTTYLAVIIPAANDLVNGRERTIRGASTGTQGLQILLRSGFPALNSQYSKVLTTGTIQLTAGVPAVVIWTTDGASGNDKFSVNGTSAGASTNTQFTSAKTTYIGMNADALANNAPDFQGYYGDIAELIQWNRVLTKQEQLLLVRYVKTTYGIDVLN